jgi:hypothetical protein
MVTLVRSDRLRARARASLAQIGKLSAGQALAVRVDGVDLNGTLVEPGLVAPGHGDPDGYEIEVQFAPPADRDWRAGQPAEVLLP